MKDNKFGSYHSFWVANNLIQLSKRDGYSLTNLHMQKLLYFLHGHYLVETDRSLLEEKFQPWYYGPVLESIYYSLKIYGAEPVDEYCKQFKPDSKSFIAYIAPQEDKDFYSLLEKFWRKYKTIENPFDLVHLSHKFGGAWHKAREENELYINNEDIKEEFNNIHTLL